MVSATMHHGIIVGIDGSSAAADAVQWAAHEAAMHNVPLTLIHVLPSPVVMTWPDLPLPAAFMEWPREEGRIIVRNAVALAEAAAERPIHIKSDMVAGPAVAALADLSKEAQMVVVGCRGRGRLHQLLGSVSAGLIHHGHCPVVVVHDDDPLIPDPDFASVVVGIDGSPASESATAIAFDEASRRGVQVVAIHACSDWGGGDHPGIDWPLVEQRGYEVLAERLAGWQERYPDVSVHRVVVADNAAEHLVARSKRAQLIVVGSHGRGGFAGMLLGSVSSAVAQTVRIPVIVARTS
ncbi:universal stress protein [Mycolicibacterium komossense]|uniref:Universal stress protein n=1 Tax=Mycolicibacterium komossense TaxID=1779 RepID=A0ABT3CJF0_9MYCO|nr:universal stress protein [Mycolicibacterium komossense]MCV7229585.1 universal stress protein [Mycolicibacterium komossense]